MRFEISTLIYLQPTETSLNPKELTLLTIILLLPTSIVWAAIEYTSQNMEFTLYFDKSTLITNTVAVSPAMAKVTVPLLGSGFSDMLVSDNTGGPLKFNVTLNSVNVATLGASSINITYVTNGLVTSAGDLFTFNVTTHVTSKVTLPKTATIISTNVAPLEITTKDQTTMATLPASNLSLLYTSVSGAQPYTPRVSPLSPLLIIGVLIGVLLAFLLIMRGRKRN